MFLPQQAIQTGRRLVISLSERVNNLLDRAGQGFDPQRRREIISEVFSIWVDPQTSLRRFGILMGLSVVIAAYGMADDSEAVVIGAMLIAPLMTPVLGVAVSIAMGWPARLWRSVLLIAAATAGAVTAAFLVQLMIPTIEAVPNALEARTSPRVIDLSIALAAGVAGSLRADAARGVGGAARRSCRRRSRAASGCHRDVPGARRVFGRRWHTPAVHYEPHGDCVRSRSHISLFRVHPVLSAGAVSTAGAMGTCGGLDRRRPRAHPARTERPAGRQ